jgi:hypothetical protein
MNRTLAVSITSFVVALSLSGCGSSGGSSSPTPVTQPPAPAASITAAGAGALVLHPSLNPVFGVAMETPIRITETGGGTADWNFARMQIFRRGAEVERLELTATTIAAAGATRIAASSTTTRNVIFRFNTDDFDNIVITLGFADLKDGRQFQANVSFGTFSDVTVSVTPLTRRYSPEPI